MALKHEIPPKPAEEWANLAAGDEDIEARKCSGYRVAE